MFEITPKEQLLKNVRKGLVQPLPNKYPLLNFEKDLLKKPLLKTDESFIKVWVENGFFFSVYNGPFDLLQQVRNTIVHYKLGVPAMEEKMLKDLFQENEMAYLSPEKMDMTLICSFSKLEVSTNSLYFSSEFQPIKYFKQTSHLILYGKASQIDSPENNKYFSDLMIKSDFKVHLPIDYLKKFHSVFLFIEE